MQQFCGYPLEEVQNFNAFVLKNLDVSSLELQLWFGDGMPASHSHFHNLWTMWRELRAIQIHV